MNNLKELYLTYPIEQSFNDLTNNIVIKENIRHINYFNENNKLIFQYDKTNRNFWYNFEEYYTIIFEIYKFDRLLIEDVTKDLIMKYFNLKNIIPKMGFYY
jgi:hypothetical protein